jgi:hypothetical protein
MIRVRIKIGSNGNPVDTADTYGLVYLDSDKRVGAEQKEFEATAYPEEEGEHIMPKTVDAPFDYKVKFFVDPSVPENTDPEDLPLHTANAKIAAFNAALHGTPDANGQKEYYQVEFYNDHKRHKIVGYPHEIAEATDFWRDPTNQVNDVVVVEWTIRVTKPSLCDFSL